MLENIKELQKCALATCDKDNLVDLQNISIDTEKSKIERILDFMNQIKNPYLFKVGDIAVKVTFNNNGNTFQSAMENLILANLGN